MEINKSITAIIILTINLILIFLFVIPKYQESIDLQINLLKKQVEYDSQSDYYIKLLGIIKSIEGRKDVLEKVDNALPSNFSLASVFYFFQKKSIENQLIIKSITFSGGSLGDSRVQAEGLMIKSISFTINLSGSYQGLKNFLSSLDRSDRLFQVENISFVSSKPLLNPELSNLPDQLQAYDFKLEVKTNTY